MKIRQTDAVGNVQSTGLGTNAAAITVDQTVTLSGYNTRVGGGGGYWFIDGVNGNTSGFMPNVMGGTRVGFNVWTAADIASIDYSIAGGNYGTVTNDQVNGFNNSSYWTFYITMPNINVSSGMINFVFKDTAGNGVNAYITGGNNSTFDVTINVSPLVLDLNGDGVHTTGVQDGVLFDVLDEGKPIKSGWTDGVDGLLVLDLNGDGKINNGKELFGNGTDTPSGKAQNGFVALAQHDLNADGVINVKDEVFSELQIWVDADHDGLTDQGELKSLLELNVASLSLNSQQGTQIDNGNLLGLTSSWTGSEGTMHDLADVFFASISLETLVQQATAKLDLDADPAANVQNVHLADVLATDQKLMVIKTGSNDVVNLDLNGWSNSGTTTAADNHTYALWNNGAAHLLIDQNASVYQVL